MLTGVFLLLFGLAIWFGSVSLFFIFAPLYILLHVVELKTIEEPELARRLGREYLEYKKSTPMFIPRLRAKSIEK
jgi:protein-S-isoprenylcysteine O-methyltransferase Ste14